ncbi:HAMP domain-containing protein [Indioceanicola profundi]|uniref:HAMP domain-containing protein n=1 Tax=Indioceanicola profundi TaxID=2220096 RepID=UPI000E6AC7E5|nr:methyl-accepting chemotaxis protein [Indioceanicola profundi]
MHSTVRLADSGSSARPALSNASRSGAATASGLAGEDSTPETIIHLAAQVSEVASQKTNEIADITRRIKMLALNAKIEAARAGQHGAGFGVVAGEVQSISTQIAEITSGMQAEIVGTANRLHRLGDALVQSMRGQRMADMALNMIDIIDRNLYERSCDVRWWATDSAVVDCLEKGTEEARSWASRRLGVILNSYTVYLDLWIADLDGRVVASGRPGQYPGVIGSSVKAEGWFRNALSTRDGTEFAVADIARCPALNNRAVATYATAIREGGMENGRPLGVLGIQFDWEPQAMAVVKSVRLTEDEQREGRTRCLLLDSTHRIIAASDGAGLLDGRYPLRTGGKDTGHYQAEDGTSVGFALTPGYETYKGLGWYGLILQRAV